MANRLTFLLPHDKSYFAIRHFGTHSGLLLDVGANTGISALSFLRLEAGLRILSLEPNPIHERPLRRLKKKLGPSFDYKIVGAGDRPGELQLVTPVFRGIALHTFTSASEARVKSGVEEVFGGRVARKCRYVHNRAPLIRVDDLAVDPVVVKIDAEGVDFEVLAGARQTLQRSRPFVLVEIQSDIRRFSAFFAALRYTLLAYDFASDSFEEADIAAFEFTRSAKNFCAVPDERISSLPARDRAAPITNLHNQEESRNKS
jgi:FkbM family methyltransferase